MSASRSSPARARAARRAAGTLAAALLGALAAAGCTTRDVESRPFRVTATLGDGRSLAELAPDQRYYVLFGQGEVLGPTELRLTGAVFGDGSPFGDLTLAFDGGAEPGAVLPDALDGVPVRVVVLADPASVGPRGEPLPVPGFRAATGTSPDFRTRFLVFEATYSSSRGVADLAPPATAVPEDPGPVPDFPDFLVEATFTSWEPGECGLVYHDVLNVIGDREEDDLVLGRGERGRVPIVAQPDEQPWTIHHVGSWHRDGRCGGEIQAFTQLVAWRPAPASATP